MFSRWYMHKLPVNLRYRDLYLIVFILFYGAYKYNSWKNSQVHKLRFATVKIEDLQFEYKSLVIFTTHAIIFN